MVNKALGLRALKDAAAQDDTVQVFLLSNPIQTHRTIHYALYEIRGYGKDSSSSEFEWSSSNRFHCRRSFRFGLKLLFVNDRDFHRCFQLQFQLEASKQTKPNRYSITIEMTKKKPNEKNKHPNSFSISLLYILTHTCTHTHLHTLHTWYKPASMSKRPVIAEHDQRQC